MGTLLLIRHGQASYGEADYDRLSTRGEQQARALGAFLAMEAPLDSLYTGPLRRQRQTGEFAIAGAATLARGNALPAPTIVPELAEYPAFEMLEQFVPMLVAADAKFAALTTAPTPALLDDAFRTILARWARGEWTHDAVEHVDAFVARVRTGLDRVIRAAGAKARIAIMTSAGPIGVAVGFALGSDAERMVRTSVVIRNASITELKFRSREFAWQPEQLSLFTFNGVGHLPADLRTDR